VAKLTSSLRKMFWPKQGYQVSSNLLQSKKTISIGRPASKVATPHFIDLHQPDILAINSRHLKNSAYEW
jgi:hypothetical protein